MLRSTPSRVLLLGGYGTFGKRIAARLAKNTNISLIVAGRSRHKAKELADRLSASGKTVRSEELDATKGRPSFSQQLSSLKPDIVINACGSYTDTTLEVAKDAIKNGAHYIDLADNRYVVERISELHEEAKKHNVLVTSGASSVPALSSAVVDSFLDSFSKIDSIEHSISPGNKNERGLGTIESILSYCGKPFQQLREGEWKTVYGWQEMKHETYQGTTFRRWVANVDVPDLSLFPKRYPTAKTVTFRAGVELDSFSLALSLFSRLSRAGLVSSWAPYARQLQWLSELFLSLGTEEGAMKVKIAGRDREGKQKVAYWFLYGDGKDGPEVPCTAAVALAEKLADPLISPSLPRGAFPCVGLLSLDDFLASLSSFSVITYRHEYSLAANPLAPESTEGGRESLRGGPFSAALGHWVHWLPAHIAAFHERGGNAKGKLKVTRGKGFLINLLADIGGLPKARESADVTVQALLGPGIGVRTWNRYFDGKLMSSRISTKRHWLQIESFFPWKLGFQVLPYVSEDGRRGFAHKTKRVWFIGVPLPRFLSMTADDVVVETRDGKGWELDVHVRLPLLGTLVRYTGTMYPA